MNIRNAIAAILTISLLSPSVFANQTEKQISELQNLVSQKQTELFSHRMALKTFSTDLEQLKKDVEQARSSKQTAKYIAIPGLIVSGTLFVSAGRLLWKANHLDWSTKMAGGGALLAISAGGAALLGTLVGTPSGVYLYVSTKKLDQIEELVKAAEARIVEENRKITNDQAVLDTLGHAIELLIVEKNR